MDQKPSRLGPQLQDALYKYARTIFRQIGGPQQAYLFALLLIQNSISKQRPQDIDRFVIVPAALLLGFKLAECPRDIKDITRKSLAYSRAQTKKSASPHQEQVFERLLTRVKTEEVLLLLRMGFGLCHEVVWVKNEPPGFESTVTKALHQIYKSDVCLFGSGHELVELAQLWACKIENKVAEEYLEGKDFKQAGKKAQLLFLDERVRSRVLGAYQI